MSHFVAPMPPKPWRGTDNLRCYLFEATLPNMPTSSTVPWTPEGHKTHLNVLKVRHERYRRFYGIQSLDPIEFDDLVAEWMDQYIPSQPLRAADRDEKTGARLTIPAPEFSIEWPEKRKPTSISSIHTWIDELPLETAQRAAQLAFPSLRQHEFVPNGEADPADHEIFNYFLWSDPLAESPFGNVVVVYQPPWILSLHDLKCFCNKQTFPSFPTGHGSKPLDSSERLWGKIWDLCVRKGTPWFVVSTYMGWVFGAFSAGWTKAWVSPIKEFDAYDPSVIQCLVYWLAAAGGLKGCWEIPKVFESVYREEDGAFKAVCMNALDDESRMAIEVAPSESHWDGKSDSPTPFKSPLILSPLVSAEGLPFRQPPQPRAEEMSWTINNWRQQSGSATLVGESELGAFQPPSPGRSEISDSTMSDDATIKVYTASPSWAHGTGHWVGLS